METFTYLVMIAIAGAIGYSFWRMGRNWQDRTRASEARMTSFMAQALPKLAPAALPAIDPAALAQQRLLFEAAAKAAEAGEAVLAIQLYARLLSRYPESGFAGPARAAVDVQKKKLAKR